MRIIDLIEPMVVKFFGPNQQFLVVVEKPKIDAENLWPGAIAVESVPSVKGIKVLNIVVGSRGLVTLYVNACKYWEYDIHDPDALDNIKAKLEEFAQKKVEDLEPEERFKPNPWFAPGGV